MMKPVILLSSFISAIIIVRNAVVMGFHHSSSRRITSTIPNRRGGAAAKNNNIQNHAIYKMSFDVFPDTKKKFRDLFKSNPFQFQNQQQKQGRTTTTTTTPTTPTTIPEKFIDAINSKNIKSAMSFFDDDDDDVTYENTDFYSPFVGKSEVERYLRLRSDSFPNELIQIQGISVDDDNNKVGISFVAVNNAKNNNVEKNTVDDDDDSSRTTTTTASSSSSSSSSNSGSRKGVASFGLDVKTGLIRDVFVIQESNKSGEANLKTLKVASDIISIAKSKQRQSNDDDGNDNTIITDDPEVAMSNKKSTKTLSLPERYFEAWNERDMAKACSLFSDDIQYDDTAFPEPFVGKINLEKHLNVCADAFPDTFRFVVDDTVIDESGGGKNEEKQNQQQNALVRWHVVNNDEELPFTRGVSFYKIENGKITEGMDTLEPAVFKLGSLDLLIEGMRKKLVEEPIRLIPIAIWISYMYVVFFSDWFFGLPATALEQRTWEEVRDLSLNFFFVSPILGLSFAPVVHPMLEATFNLLLSWAALFAGFLSDDREDKPNLIPMLPMVAGMQFLTSAFLLPYLATRSTENLLEDEPVYQESLSMVSQLAESKLLGISLATVGTGSIFWALFARMQDFGPWDQRLGSFLDLLSIDRVGSSFIVDLIIFGLFQGWLIDDDMKRRAMTPNSVLAKAAKYIPFFGMAAYMTFRKSLKVEEEES